MKWVKIMWGQWREKLKNLFRDKTTEHDAAKKNSLQIKREVHSKIMYHYPKRSAFRFPVIPDKPTNKEPSDTPAYKRRQNQHRSDRSKKDVQHTNNTGRTPEFIKRDTNIPFRPSRVPSPIYGYQPRKMDEEIENVPTYVRNQENKDIHHKTMKEDSAVSNASHEHMEEDKESDWKEPYQDKQQHQPDISEDKSKKSTITSIEKAVKDTDSVNAEKNTTSRSGVSGISHKKERRHVKQARTNNRQQAEQQKPVPFNVMMSHNDKLQMKQSQKQKSFTRKTETIEHTVHMPYHLLNDKVDINSQDRPWVRNQQELLEKTFSHFNVDARVVHATKGPSVTRFEVQPALGVKVSKVKNLSDDIKLNLSAKDIRIEAPIPGKNTIGIEIPNPNPQLVAMQEILDTETFKNNKSQLTIGLGSTIEGHPYITNIEKMPHGLIAGATGSGKSVCINTILISLLYKADYESVKFLLIDPKMVELAPYNGIPNLISPVITDVKAATMALKWAVKEMEERYDKFVHEGVRDIERYNAKMVKNGFKEEKMSYIVIVIDELADLMMVSPQDVEDAICRIAQKARACGIHLLLATQRPSVDVITGLIKANIPTRIAFSVSSQVDSRTVIDTNGAEKLLGKGDMLFAENGAGKTVRLQGAFVSDEEIERVTEYARSVAEPQYEFEQEQLLERVETDENEDELLEEAIQFVTEQNNASTSLLQRQFKIGYNRAARLMDSMVSRGIISEQNGSKPRDILVAGTSASNGS